MGGNRACDYCRPEFPTFFDKGPQMLLWVGSQATHVKTTLSGVPDLMSYCVIFILCSCMYVYIYIYVCICIQGDSFGTRPKKM